MAPLPRQVGRAVGGGGSCGGGGGGTLNSVGEEKQAESKQESMYSLSALDSGYNAFSSCLDFPAIVKEV